MTPRCLSLTFLSAFTSGCLHVGWLGTTAAFELARGAALEAEREGAEREAKERRASAREAAVWRARYDEGKRRDEEAARAVQPKPPPETPTAPPLVASEPARRPLRPRQ